MHSAYDQNQELAARAVEPPDRGLDDAMMSRVEYLYQPSTIA